MKQLPNSMAPFKRSGSQDTESPTMGLLGRSELGLCTGNELFILSTVLYVVRAGNLRPAKRAHTSTRNYKIVLVGNAGSAVMNRPTSQLSQDSYREKLRSDILSDGEPFVKEITVSCNQVIMNFVLQ